MFQHSFSISKNTCTESLPALPWPSGCGSLWPQFHFCYSQPQSVDLGSAEETKKEGEREERWVIPYFSLHDRKYHAIFGLNWKTHNTAVTERLLDVGGRARQDRSWSVWRGGGKKNKDLSHSRGNIYLLKAGPDLLSFCSSAMFAPLFSTRKEKFQVRDDRMSFRAASGQQTMHMEAFLYSRHVPHLLSDSQRQEDRTHLRALVGKRKV